MSRVSGRMVLSQSVGFAEVLFEEAEFERIRVPRLFRPPDASQGPVCLTDDVGDVWALRQGAVFECLLEPKQVRGGLTRAYWRLEDVFDGSLVARVLGEAYLDSLVDCVDLGAELVASARRKDARASFGVGGPGASTQLQWRLGIVVEWFTPGDEGSHG